VECQLQIIGNCVLPGVARKKLKQLPTTLYDSYDRILESISEENIGTVRSALMFLAHSMRPMTVEEIADAVLIDVEEQSFDPEERTVDPLSVILELCSSLVTVTEAHQDEKLHLFSWTRQYGSLGVVRFAHYSVKEYIISERNRQTALNGFYFDEVSSHQHITQALLLYILTIASSEEEARRPPYDSKNTPLRFYASRYWPQHCRQVPPEKRSLQLLEHIYTLFNTEDPGPYIFWLNSYNQDYDPKSHAFHRFERSLAQFAPPIYFASLLGELSTCEWLIENGHQNDDPNHRSALGTALQAAALGNHTKIVQLLLNQGSQVNTDCGNFGDPLQAAAFGGGLETVELLLNNGAFINTEHGEYGNALIAAAHMGHLEVAKKLIECGADPELSSRENGKAIAGAAASGQAELVKLLLLKGNDINDPNEPTGTALYCASKTGDVQLVRMLIKAGADVDCISGKLHTALQAACNEGHVQVVKVLLANGAGVNIFGGQLDSALQACIDHGNMDILQLLLDHGADLNHEGGLYHSPLHCATFRGKARAAEILLDRNAKFNDEIFLMAIEYDHKSLVSRMFSKGVNVNAQGKEGTALQLAIQRKDSQTARALLADDSIEIDARGGKHGATALHLALITGNEEMVLELLRKGASVNAEGSEFYKPLTAAVASGNEKLIHLVLDAGADINGHRGGWYDSALNVAARKGLKDVISLLLELGMDINESSGRTEDAKCRSLAL
jgi:ankyrin repeat protein